MSALKEKKSGTSWSLDLYWKDIQDYRPLTKEEEEALFERFRAGDTEARDQLVKANLRFVVSVAKTYDGDSGLTLSELVSAGNVGLLTALERFDETRGFKFITYAVWWIRQSIFKTLAEHRKIIRSPMSQLNDMNQMEKEGAELRQKLGREPTFEEISESLPLSPERLRSAIEAGQQDLSLDAPLYPEGDATLLAQFPADDADGLDTVTDEHLTEMLRGCLEVLDEREDRIVRSYFGLGNEEPKSLQEIGASMGLTRERVRQLRNRALARIRTECGELLMELSSN